MRKLLVAVLSIMLFVASTSFASDTYVGLQEPTDAEIVIDAVIARPLGIVSIALGAGVFVVALPFTLTANSVDLAARRLLVAPFNHTFKRQLGDFSQH